MRWEYLYSSTLVYDASWEAVLIFDTMGKVNPWPMLVLGDSVQPHLEFALSFFVNHIRTFFVFVRGIITRACRMLFYRLRMGPIEL